MVRKRVGGGYFTVVTPPEGAAPTKRIVYRSRFVHIAVGYPGLKFLPELQEFRQKYGDYQRVVNAYEPHEHVYESLKIRPGTVVIRGGGVVASRVLQRLFDDRERFGLQTRIIHIFRTFVTGSHGPHIWARRKGGHGWAYQGFNYPKSCGADSSRPRCASWRARRGPGSTRRWAAPTRPTAATGRGSCGPAATAATTTRCRASWRRWSPAPTAAWSASCAATTERSGSPWPTTSSTAPAWRPTSASTGSSPTCYSTAAPTATPFGRLEVERTFEVKGTASGDGALYASGSATLGGYFPGVDTFLGLQIAAQEIADDLARRGFCRRMGPLRSTAQWFKWVFNTPV